MFKIDNIQNNITAKEALILIGEKVLKTCNAPEQINLVIKKIDLVKTLRHEVYQLTQEQAQESLKQIAEVLKKYGI